MPTPTGATNYITLTSNPAAVAASMPDAGNTFAADLVIDEAAGVNWEGGAATFVSGLAADYSDLRVTDSTGAIIVPFGVKQFSQTAGSRKLILGLGIPSTAPLLSSSGVEYRLWRGCTGGQAENKAGVVPTADGWVSHWPLEDANGPLVDWTGQNNLTETGSPTHQQAAKVALGIEFSGPGQYARKTAPTGVPSGDAAFTMMAWAYPNSVTASIVCALFAVNAAPGQTASMTINNGNLSASYSFSDITTSGGLVPVDVWSLLCITKTPGNTATTTKAYINGVSKTTSGTGADTNLSPVSVAIGAGWWDNPGEYPFDGVLDEVQIHSVARSANWIATYYSMTCANAAFWTVGAEQSAVSYIPRRRVVLGRSGPSLRGVI